MAITETFHNMGFRLTYPDVFNRPKGIVSPMSIGDTGDGIYFMMYNYIAVTEEDVKAMRSKSETGELSNEDSLKLADAMSSLLQVAGIGGGQGSKEIAEKLKIEKGSGDSFTEIGRYKDITYYVITNRNSDEKYMKEIDPVFAEEFRILQTSLIDALKNAEYIGPQIPGAELVGKTIRFETRDIDGNPVKSEDLFSAHDITMINIWATWCGPCKKELEELGNIHRRLEKKNAAVIGICNDAAEKAADCKALIAEKNLSYINLLPYEGMDELAVESFPTTFFVNREGTIMTYPVIGVPGDITDYEKTIDSLLAEGTAGAKPVSETNAAEQKNTCRVIVSDDIGNPVAGVTIQFCSDITCMIGKTDAEGIASFAAEKGKYTVHVQKTPEGYETSAEEFAVPDDLTDVKITLKKHKPHRAVRWDAT